MTVRRLVLLLLVMACLGCGGGSDRSAPPLGEVLFTPDEFPGWDATRQLDPKVLFERCSQPVEGIDAVVEVEGIAFTQDHKRFGPLPGITQSMFVFAGEADAVAFMGRLPDVYLTCLAEADVRPLGRAEELDLEAADLGADAIGWRVPAGVPNPLEGTVDSSEGLFFRRGDIVASVGILLPLADEVELLDLAATTSERLGR